MASPDNIIRMYTADSPTWIEYHPDKQGGIRTGLAMAKKATGQDYEVDHETFRFVGDRIRVGIRPLTSGMKDLTLTVTFTVRGLPAEHLRRLIDEHGTPARALEGIIEGAYEEYERGRDE